MGATRSRGQRDAIADTRRRQESAKEGEMNHPETMLRFARERHERFHDEARRHESARALTSIQHQETRDRFRIRDLRWSFLRPATA
jgi:hypothetical protein